MAVFRGIIWVMISKKTRKIHCVIVNPMNQYCIVELERKVCSSGFFYNSRRKRRCWAIYDFRKLETDVSESLEECLVKGDLLGLDVRHIARYDDFDFEYVDGNDEGNLSSRMMVVSENKVKKLKKLLDR